MRKKTAIGTTKQSLLQKTAATKKCSQEQEGQTSLSSKTTLEGDVLENKPLGCLGYFAAFSKAGVPEQVNRPYRNTTEACQCSIV